MSVTAESGAARLMNQACSTEDHRHCSVGGSTWGCSLSQCPRLIADIYDHVSLFQARHFDFNTLIAAKDFIETKMLLLLFNLHVPECTSVQVMSRNMIGFS
jgi:hypothetical protein